MRGLFSGIILLAPSWGEIQIFLNARKGLEEGTSDGVVQTMVQEDLSLRPHLNSALRAEIIYFTTMVL